MDPFATAIESEAELRALYEEPIPTALRKDIGRLDEMYRRLTTASPMVLLGSVDAAGHGDVSPRGGQPGFVRVLDERHTLPSAAEVSHAHLADPALTVVDGAAQQRESVRHRLA